MSEGCKVDDVSWTQGYSWTYHVKQYKFISNSSEWLFSAGGSWRYLSNSPFSLWFGSFEQCSPRQLVRTATSVTLPPGWRGRWGTWQRWKGCSEGCWGGSRMIGWGGLPQSAFTSHGWASKVQCVETEETCRRHTIYWLGMGTADYCGTECRRERSSEWKVNNIVSVYY